LGQPSWFSRSCTPPVDAGAVDEHGVGVMRVDLLHDPAGDLHEVRDPSRGWTEMAGNLSVGLPHHGRRVAVWRLTSTSSQRL
jgi:hypothetical protein